MPIYWYRCNPCDLERRILVSPERVSVFKAECEQCAGPMGRLFPTPQIAEMETTDGYRGQSRFKDTNAKRKAHSESLTKKTTPVK